MGAMSDVISASNILIAPPHQSATSLPTLPWLIMYHFLLEICTLRLC